MTDADHVPGSGGYDSKYDKPSFSGYSMWLIPSEPKAAQYQTLIDSLAASEFVAASACPLFKPHITLAAGMLGTDDSMIAALRQISEGAAAFGVTLEKLVEGDLYFMCVYAACTRSDELLRINKHAQQVLEMSYAYTPHLSLVYGHLTNSQKHSLCESIPSWVVGDTLRIERVELWRTDGLPAEWSFVKSASLVVGH